MYSLALSLILALMPVAATAKSILVFGDSISAGYGIDVKKGWVNLLQQKFNAEHRDYVISNESISGDTSAGGLARIDQALARHKPDLVMLELGGNDGLRGLLPQAMKSNLTEMILRSRKAGAQVALLGMKIPPNYGKRYIDMFYNVYPQLATELKVPLLPFILEDVALNPDLMQVDGLHPNEMGQTIIAEKVWLFLQPLLQKD
jgi:Lysophospholipase L1 and related esterases